MDDQKLEVKCAIHARPMANSKIQLVRMDCEFKGGLEMKHFDLWMKDIVPNMKSDPTIQEMKVLETSKVFEGFPTLIYFVMKMSGMAARSCIITYDRIDEDDGGQFLITKSVEHPDYPNDGKTIRMDVFSAAKAFPIDGGFTYREYSSYNMKGWFPPRLLNMMIGASSVAQIKEMQK